MLEELTPDELRRHMANLAELQRIDSELVAVEKRLAQIPEKIAGERRRLDSKTTERANLAASAEDHVRERRDIEREINEHEEKIKRLQAQLFQIKSQREYDAIGVEIDGLKQQVGGLEDRELALLDEDDNRKARLASLETEITALRTEVETAVKRHDEARAELERTREVLQRDRERYSSGYPPGLVEQYRLLHQRYPDSAVVPVSGNTCGGCRMNLVSQTLLQVHTGQRLTTCEHCGRILLPSERAS